MLTIIECEVGNLFSLNCTRYIGVTAGAVVEAVLDKSQLPESQSPRIIYCFNFFASKNFLQILSILVILVKPLDRLRHKH